MTRLKPATDQVHLWFGMTRHRLPGWSAPFLRGGRFVSPGRGCRAPTPPPMHARLALASWYEVRHGEVWDDPPLRRA